MKTTNIWRNKMKNTSTPVMNNGLLMSKSEKMGFLTFNGFFFYSQEVGARLWPNLLEKFRNLLDYKINLHTHTRVLWL